MTKELEALNWLNHQARCGYVDEITQRIIKDKTDLIEKSLKALEIIKNKQVDFQLFFNCKNATQYNIHNYFEENYLTQEEFELLKGCCYESDTNKH